MNGVWESQSVLHQYGGSCLAATGGDGESFVSFLFFLKKKRKKERTPYYNVFSFFFTSFYPWASVDVATH